jgi:hypothetical protein
MRDPAPEAVHDGIASINLSAEYLVTSTRDPVNNKVPEDSAITFCSAAV